MKKIFISLMAVMLLVGLVPATIIEASEVEVSEVEVSEVKPLEITDRTGFTITITHNNVNLRSGPGTNFASLGQVHSGNRGTHLQSQWGTDGNLWYQVRMTSGPNVNRTGWVRADYAIWW